MHSLSMLVAVHNGTPWLHQKVERLLLDINFFNHAKNNGDVTVNNMICHTPKSNPSVLVINLWIVNYIIGFILAGGSATHGARDSWHWSWFGCSPRVAAKIEPLKNIAGQDRWWLMGCQAFTCPHWMANDPSRDNNTLLSRQKMHF